MDLNELQNEVDRDLKIDDTELDLESIRTPQLHNKYLKHYTKYSLQYKKAKMSIRVYINLSGNTILVNLILKFINLNHSI